MKLPSLALALLAGLPGPSPADDARGLLRINTTIQTFDTAQPWELDPPRQRRGLGALLPGKRIITTGEMAANSTYIELESADGIHTTPGKVLAIDYEANLALLAPESDPAGTWLDTIGELEVNGPVNTGDEVQIWQLEENGDAINTTGTVRSVDLISTFVPGHYFLAYEVKASLQSASSSYTVPVTREGKLLGVLTSYDSKDQISDIIAPEIISAFLEDVEDGVYNGFPSLGIASILTEDPPFRQWLGLDAYEGGLYISRVLPESAAAKCGLKEGDVLLAVGDQFIDRRGYYVHPRYGRLFWSHLIRGSRMVGETLSLLIHRDGEERRLEAALERAVEPLIPAHMHDRPPPYLVKGGLVFQELSRQYFEAFGKEWQQRAPLNLLDALHNPEDYEEGRRRLVFLSRVIPTPATIGYDDVSNQIISEVNGRKVEDMASLAAAFRQPVDGLHTIRIDDVPYVLYLDPRLSDFVDGKLLEAGLPSLQRLGD